MTYWSIVAFVAAIAFMVCKQGLMSWNNLPRWLMSESWRGGEQNIDTKDKAQGDAEQRSRSESAPQAAEPDSDVLDADSTPKAKPTRSVQEVPTLSLGTKDQRDKIPSFPAAKSAQRVSSSMAPPPKPASSGLMPPPARPAVSRGPPPSASSSLRVPSTGPLQNRGPLSNSQQRASGGLSPSGAVSTLNARGKVLLKPGHSPMDWAALTRSGNLSGVPIFQRVTPSQLKTMTGRKGKPAWSSWQGKVYNITPYLPFHPGGEAELLKAAGRDGTKLFMEVHPWVNWDNMLEKCLVGVMVPEEQTTLDDMD